MKAGPLQKFQSNKFFLKLVVMSQEEDGDACPGFWKTEHSQAIHRPLDDRDKSKMKISFISFRIIHLAILIQEVVKST